jgi:hypothetical protein
LKYAKMKSMRRRMMLFVVGTAACADGGRRLWSGMCWSALLVFAVAINGGPT